MNREADIYYFNTHAGILSELDEWYHFQYSPEYLEGEAAEAISLTMPLQTEVYESKTLFPFFDGLIPEGWLLDLATESWKINPRDRMGLLLSCCKECIGAVSVVSKEGHQ